MESRNGLSDVRIGQFGVYFLVENCCGGYGEIVKVGGCFVEIERSRFVIGCLLNQVDVFDSREAAKKHYNQEFDNRPCLKSLYPKCRWSCCQI
jgi:hypothetical protein